MKNPMLVMQDPDNQIVAPTVHGELAFNMENRGWDSDRIVSGVRRIREIVGLPWDGDRHPNTLSGGEREMLNVATALSVRPDVLVIDDAMAFLSDANKKRVVEILKEHCRKEGAAVLWFTSDLSDLKYGSRRWELRLDKLDSEIEESVPLEREYSPAPGRLMLEIDALTFSYDGEELLFRGQTVTVGPFRSLAMLGENGSGKSTLGYLMVGLLRAVEGRVTLSFENGRPARVGFLPQTPERLFGGRTFSELLTVLIRNDLFEEHNTVKFEKRLKEFQISWDLICQELIHREKISIVRVVLVLMMLWAEYDVVILDEPTFSLGENQKGKLIVLMHESMSSKHLILISHSEGIARRVCQEALTIQDGVINRTPLRKYLPYAGKRG